MIERLIAKLAKEKERLENQILSQNLPDFLTYKVQLERVRTLGSVIELAKEIRYDDEEDE